MHIEDLNLQNYTMITELPSSGPTNLRENALSTSTIYTKSDQRALRTLKRILKEIKKMLKLGLRGF